MVPHACIYSTSWSDTKSLWTGHIATSIFTKITLKLLSLQICWHIHKNKALCDTFPKNNPIYSHRWRWVLSSYRWIYMFVGTRLSEASKQLKISVKFHLKRDFFRLVIPKHNPGVLIAQYHYWCIMTFIHPLTWTVFSHRVFFLNIFSFVFVSSIL